MVVAAVVLQLLQLVSLLLAVSPAVAMAMVVPVVRMELNEEDDHDNATIIVTRKRGGAGGCTKGMTTTIDKATVGGTCTA